VLTVAVKILAGSPFDLSRFSRGAQGKAIAPPDKRLGGEAPRPVLKVQNLEESTHPAGLANVLFVQATQARGHDPRPSEITNDTAGIVSVYYR
jgi:hypothetical protein